MKKECCLCCMYYQRLSRHTGVCNILFENSKNITNLRTDEIEEKYIKVYDYYMCDSFYKAINQK
jgi:hypothetical protein